LEPGPLGMLCGGPGGVLQWSDLPSLGRVAHLHPLLLLARCLSRFGVFFLEDLTWLRRLFQCRVWEKIILAHPVDNSEEITVGVE